MVLPGQYNGEQLATAQREFSSAGLNLDDVVREEVHHPTQELGIYTQEYHFCLGKASQEGRVTGATDGSMLAGSVYTRNMIAKVIAEEIDPDQHH